MLRGRMRFAFTCITLAVCCSASAEQVLPSWPEPAKKQITFAEDIQPIFENSCIRCHGADKPKSKFSLVTREAALRGGANGVAIVPGDSLNSRLIHYVAGLDEEMMMPQASK